MQPTRVRMMNLRLAVSADLPAIVSIHNEAIADRATADLDPLTADDRGPWLETHPPDLHPVIVAVNAADIVGWASLSAYRPGRRALRHTAEISYFVRGDQRRRGIGRSLVGGLIERCPALGIRTVFAILLEDNEASIALLESCGFERWAHLPDVADFDGRRVGHVYYGLRTA